MRHWPSVTEPKWPTEKQVNTRNCPPTQSQNGRRKSRLTRETAPDTEPKWRMEKQELRAQCARFGVRAPYLFEAVFVLFAGRFHGELCAEDVAEFRTVAVPTAWSRTEDKRKIKQVNNATHLKHYHFTDPHGLGL